MSERDELLPAALDYARRGWPVFPVAKRGKLPAIASAHPQGDERRGSCRGECGSDGHGLHDATTDAERITGWWKQYRDANIGLRTGIAFDVLDIDGLDGLDALNTHRADRPTTWGPETLTGRGGHHLLFLPTGYGNRAGIVPHVDWRGVGGYIVAPPSVHPEGPTYQWTVAGPDTPLESVPDWLLELVAPATAVTSGVAPGTPFVGVMSDASTYGQRALETEVGRVLLAPEGQRNHQLNRAAFALGQLVAGGVLDERDVVTALVEAASRAGLDGVETERTIASGLRDGKRQPRGIPA